MSKDNEAKVKISGDVEELKQAFNDAQKHFQTLRSEASLIEAQFKNTGDKAKYLEDMHKNLAAQIKENTEKQESLRKQLELAIQAEDSENVEKLTQKLNRQEMQGENLARQMRELENEIEKEKSAFGKLTNEIESQESELKKLKNEYANAVLQYGKNSDEAKNLSNQIENLSQSLSENKAELENARQSADEFDDTIEKLNNSAESASNGGFTVMKGAVASLVADGIKTAADEMKNFVVETDSANSVFQAQTGASAEEMEKFNQAMINIYSNNFGDDMLDIANSMAQVKQQTKETDPSKLQELTEHAILLRDTFDMDIQESMRAVKMLMDQFGISGQEAFNLIIQGAQNGLNKNGDLLDSINEYSVHYKQQGYSAEQFFNSLLNGTEAGTFSVDKLGDAMKEFGIRTKDTADSTTEGFQLIGLNADYMRAEFAKGGEAAQVATEKTLKALFSMKDEVKQNQAGVDLFGTMWEDLGIKGVEALMNTQGAISNNVDALSELNEVRYDNLTDFLAGIQRQIESDVMPVINEVFPLIQECIQEPLTNFADFTSNTIIPILSETLTWMSEHQNLMKGIAIVIGVVVAALGAYQAVKTIGIALETAHATSLWGLVTAQSASAAAGWAALAPILATIAVIGLVVAAIVGIVYLIKNYGSEIAQFFENLFNGFIDFVVNIFNNIEIFFVELYNFIKELLTFIFYVTISLVISIVDFFIDSFNKTREFIINVFNSVKDFIISIVNSISDFLIYIFTTVKNIFISIKLFVINIINSIIQSIISKVQFIYNKTKEFIEKIIDNIIRAISVIKFNVIGLINIIIGGVENGVNRVIRGINTMINGFNKIIGIGGAVLGIDVQIPNIKEISLPRVALAEGGIAFSPVQALIGEGGEPEAVAPISVLQRYIENSVESKLNTYMMIDYTRLAESMAAMQTIIELNSREVGRAIRS